jgi:hypothetical protein
MSMHAYANRLLFFAALATGVAASRPAAADAPLPAARLVRSPAGQAGSSTSWIYKTTTAPAGSTQHWVDFDYGVDTENGYDQLFVEWSTNNVSYTVLSTLSGSKAGHLRLNLAPLSGLVYVRFRYTTDATISVGLNAVWIDNVSFSNQAGLYASEDFGKATVGATPTGWSSGGALTGFKTQRPYVERSVGAPRNQLALTTTSMQQVITFPSAKQNSCRFDYMIDATATSYLRVWEGATKIFETTGTAHRGGEKVMLTSTAGAKTLKFEFVRGSGSAGLDTAKIANLQCRSGNLDFVAFDLQGRALGIAPPGWTQGCTSQGGSCAGVAGWQVHKRSPHVSYVPELAASPEPVVDGVITPKEYPDRTALQLRPYDQTTELGELTLSMSTSGKLYVGAKLKTTTPGVVGSETGTIVLYLDDVVQNTLGYVGCAGDVHYPGADDRRIRFDYNLAANSPAQVISIFTQVKGLCTGAWGALSGSPYFTTTATVRDEGDDVLAMEIAITLGGGIPAANKLGFCFMRTNAAMTSWRERFPYREDHIYSPADNDTYTWETTYLAPTPATGPITSEQPADACCFEKGNAFQ